MPITWQFDKQNLVILKATGQLSVNEYHEAQVEMESAIRKVGSIKLLIFLDNFTGWEKSEGWGDISSVEKNDPFIEKMAIVGEEQWRDMANTFTLRGLRPVPIEYFADDEESVARQWLDENTD